MSADETQIIELDFKGLIFFVGIIIKKLFFGDHRITVFCFIVERNHGKSLLKLTDSDYITIS
jgi:hypothetical protein